VVIDIDTCDTLCLQVKLSCGDGPDPASNKEEAQMDASAVVQQLLKTPEAGCGVEFTPPSPTLGARKCKSNVTRCDRKWTGKKVTARVTWLNQSHLVTSTHLFELEMSSV